MHSPIKNQQRTSRPITLPFPMHSPIKNQQRTSRPITVLMVASFTVQSLKVCFCMFAIFTLKSEIALGISAGVGGTNSTLAYLTKVVSLGLANTLADSMREGSFFTSWAILNLL